MPNASTTIAVRSAAGKPVRDLVLPAKVTQLAVKAALVHQVVVGEAANRRAGTAHTKNRAEVSGGGKKPWKQKGTGRARQGSIRAPQWKGGGVVHGPRNERNWAQRTPVRMVRQARAMVVADYLTSGRVAVVDALPGEPKAKLGAEMIKNLGLGRGRKLLVLLTDTERETARAFRNLPGVTVTAVRQLNALDGLSYRAWLVSEQGYQELAQLTS